MHKLFAEDSFAYTLLGDKPLSWACYKQPWPFTNWPLFFDSLQKYHRTIRTGWKTWSKYQHLFPEANLWAEKSKKHPGWVSILIVNQEQFDSVVQANKDDFQQVLNKQIIDGFHLLQEARKSTLMNEALNSHQALLGIVLGYGRNNSWAFLKSCEQHKPLGCVWEDCPSVLQLETGDPYECLSLLSCPSFAGDPNSEESLALKQNYLQTKQKVLDYYKNKDFLEATLSLLAGYRPDETLKVD